MHCCMKPLLPASPHTPPLSGIYATISLLHLLEFACSGIGHFRQGQGEFACVVIPDPFFLAARHALSQRHTHFAFLACTACLPISTPKEKEENKVGMGEAGSMAALLPTYSLNHLFEGRRRAFYNCFITE